MSEFDKEAERERLREQYERDQRKRETTEKMSELLLQGATMTNAHCSECNDPIFRYDGQEFCPTCEKPVERVGDDDEREGTEDGETDDADPAGDGQRDDAASIEVTSPSDDARVSFGGTVPGEDADEEDAAEREPAGSGGAEPAERRSRPTGGESESVREPAGRERVDGPAEPRERPPADRERSEVPEFQRARESLVRTLVRFSERAEASEDPRQAREHLAAAREAAETLDALR